MVTGEHYLIARSAGRTQCLLQWLLSDIMGTASSLVLSLVERDSPVAL